MILLWGLEGEAPLAAAGAALARLGAPFEVLDQRDVLDTEVRLAVAAGVRGWVRTPGRRIDLAAVTALYARPYPSHRLPPVRDAGPDSPAWRHAHQVEQTLWAWAQITPALVVNRPAAMATNHSKPYQAACIRRLGFAVPETLVTTDPAAARDFWRTHRDVIYKSVSGVRSRVARLRPEDDSRLDEVVWCPTQFQAYVSGREHRVHVVGSEVFACEIISSADDYRYAGRHDLAMHACALPEPVADRCRALATALDLPVAGIDLRHGADGQWYCFEVNPSPAFTFYEQAKQQPIGDAISRLLAAARPAASTLDF